MAQGVWKEAEFPGREQAGGDGSDPQARPRYQGGPAVTTAAGHPVPSAFDPARSLAPPMSAFWPSRYPSE